MSTSDSKPTGTLVPKFPPPRPKKPAKKRSHLVVDGSNIATEGRSLPSMEQLEEAVGAFLSEHSYDTVTVIVDATFGHRINAKERKWYEEAVALGTMITPPAGVIGRGDAFILEVARRADAIVLSNDSFQEFHGQHPWLFEDGRLFGGKPIPNVGWIFVARAPVRGATSRRAVRGVRASKPAAPVDVEPADQPREDDAARRKRSRRRRSGSVASESTTPTKASTVTSKAAALVSQAPHQPTSSAQNDIEGNKFFNSRNDYEAFLATYPLGSAVEVTIDRFSSHGAYARHGNVECYIPTKLLSDPPPRRAREMLRVASTVTMYVHSVDDASRGIDLAGFTTSAPNLVYSVARDSESASNDTATAVSETSVSGTRQPTRRDELVAAKKKAAKKATKKAPAKKAPAKKAVKKAAKKATKKVAKKATKKVAKKATKKAAKKAGGRKKAAKRAKKA